MTVMKMNNYTTPALRVISIDPSRIVCQSPGDKEPMGSTGIESFGETTLDW